MRKLLKFSVFVLVVAAIGAAAYGCAQTGKNVSYNNPAVLTQGIPNSASGISVTTAQTTGQTLGDLENRSQVEVQVTQDVKKDILNMFQAWKAANMAEFRRVSGLGLTGNLLEDKVKEAEPFITEAEGADINVINYEAVKVTGLNGTSAIVECQLNYSGYEYNPVTKTRGDKVGPVSLKREYSLELQDNKWYIVAEKNTGTR